MGRIHYEDQHISTEKLQGRIGRSDFLLDLYWYTGKDSQLRKKDHYIHLVSDRLDINQLLNGTTDAEEDTIEKVDLTLASRSSICPFGKCSLR